MSPRVSVLLPTYDRAHYLREAIASVLGQTFGDFELIVVDDGSTDGTPALLDAIDDPRLRRLRQDNRGVGGALNAGLAVARGEFVARIDSDDVWRPDLLETQVSALEARPDAGLAYARCAGIDADGAPTAATRGGPLRYPSDPLRSLLYADYTASITTVVRRADLDAAGGWDASLSLAEDWDLSLRLAARTDFVFVDRVLAHVRRHGGNATELRAPSLADRLALRRRVLDKAFRQPGLPEPVRRLRPIAYRNLHTGAGLQWLAVGEPGRAGREFARAVRVGGNPVATAGRIGWSAAMWFGVGRFGWSSRLAAGLVERTRRGRRGMTA